MPPGFAGGCIDGDATGFSSTRGIFAGGGFITYASGPNCGGGGASSGITPFACCTFPSNATLGFLAGGGVGT
eukprot:2295726-Pyramimonas_sp.AAC.1